jgi:hypothetical protein
MRGDGELTSPVHHAADVRIDLTAAAALIRAGRPNRSAAHLYRERVT